MKYQVKIAMPIMPNFLRFEQPHGKRQEGFKESPGVPVSQLTGAEVEQFIDEWGDAFRAHVDRRREEAVSCPECDGTGWFSPTPVRADGWPCAACNGGVE